MATAGGVTSASANITDTVHSNTDRKKVEKMIQDYQQEMNDIKECLNFLQVTHLLSLYVNFSLKAYSVQTNDLCIINILV